MDTPAVSDNLVQILADELAPPITCRTVGHRQRPATHTVASPFSDQDRLGLCAECARVCHPSHDPRPIG